MLSSQVHISPEPVFWFSVAVVVFHGRTDDPGVSRVDVILVKGGGVEVKLCDRLKALEKLWELQSVCSDRDTADGLIEALASAAGDSSEAGESNDAEKTFA